MTAFTHCCVPGCRRRSSKFKSEWLCGDHWRLVDKRLKVYRTKRLKRLVRACEAANWWLHLAQVLFVSGWGPEVDVWKYADPAARAYGKWWRIENLIWQRMKRQAITRAAGI